MAESGMIGAREALRILGIDEAQLRELVARGELSAFRSRGTLKFLRSAVLALIDPQVRQSEQARRRKRSNSKQSRRKAPAVRVNFDSALAILEIDESGLLALVAAGELSAFRSNGTLMFNPDELFARKNSGYIPVVVIPEKVLKTPDTIELIDENAARILLGMDRKALIELVAAKKIQAFRVEGIWKFKKTEIALFAKSLIPQKSSSRAPGRRSRGM